MLPVELKQWCSAILLSEDGKKRRVPVDPRTQNPASVNNPVTWATYDETPAPRGFVLTEADPYVVIDLDAPKTPEDEQNIAGLLHVFRDTYIELSTSGKGYHIWCRGRWPSTLRNRKGAVEVYGQRRFIVCTEKPINNNPIIDCPQLSELAAVMGQKDIVTDTDLAPRFDDEWTMNAAFYNAPDGAWFQQAWRDGYPEGCNKSEHDMAVANKLARWTGNFEQFVRLWQSSALWRPDEKPRYVQNYLWKTFQAARSARTGAKQAIPYWYSVHGKQVWEAMQQEQLQQSLARAQAIDVAPPAPALVEGAIPMPPGLLGEVAKYIYDTSGSPVWEIAVSVAITFCSAIFGNKWRTPSGNGLGHYVVLLSDSGSGKTAATGRASALARQVENTGNPLMSTLAGPGYFASGQALLKRFADTPCMYSFLSEFDGTLKRLDPSNASDSYIEFRRVLLEVFDAERVNATAYAQKQDGTQSVDHPLFSFLGDTRADDFFELVDEQFARSGFLARLTLIEYSGPVPYPPQHYRPYVPDDLVNRVSAAVTGCARETGIGSIALAADASAHMWELTKERVDLMNSTKDELIRGAWNRFDLRVMRLASVVACGVNWESPIVTMEHVRWAEGIVRWGLERILGNRVTTGSVGDGETRFSGDIVEFVQWYRSATPKQRKNRHVPAALLERNDVFPFAAAKHYLHRRKRYKSHKLGAAKAIELALDEAVKVGALDVLSQVQCVSLNYSGRQPIYSIGEHFD